MTAKFYLDSIYAPKPNKPIRLGACAIILDKNNKILLRRRDCNRFCLIGGGMNLDESLDDCIKREIKEETGLIVNNLNLFNIFSEPNRIVEYSDGNIFRIVTTAFIAKDIDCSKLKVSEESFELKLVDIKDLENIDIVETHEKIIDEFKKYHY